MFRGPNTSSKGGPGCIAGKCLTPHPVATLKPRHLGSGKWPSQQLICKNHDTHQPDRNYMGVSKNRGGPPKWMVKIMENPFLIGWFRGPTPIFSFKLKWCLAVWPFFKETLGTLKDTDPWPINEWRRSARIFCLSWGVIPIGLSDSGGEWMVFDDLMDVLFLFFHGFLVCIKMKVCVCVPVMSCHTFSCFFLCDPFVTWSNELSPKTIHNTAFASSWEWSIGAKPKSESQTSTLAVIEIGWIDWSTDGQIVYYNSKTWILQDFFFFLRGGGGHSFTITIIWESSQPAVWCQAFLLPSPTLVVSRSCSHWGTTSEQREPNS